MTAKEHNKLLAIFHLIHGVLHCLTGVTIALICLLVGIVLGGLTGNDKTGSLISFVFALVFGTIMLLIGLIELIAGYIVLKEKLNFRLWAIIASVISLPSVPLGTALGVYGLWFLRSEEGRRFHQ